MISVLTEIITRSIEKHSPNFSENRDVYHFGVQQGLFLLLNLSTTILIGFVLGEVALVLMFTAAYAPLRSFAGGFHAKTPYRCYAISTAIISFVALSPRIVPFGDLPLVVLFLLVSSAIMVLSPIGSANKPLDSLERRVYKKRAMIICITEVVLAIVFLSMGINLIANAIFLALTIVLVLAILGKLHLRQSELYRES